MGWGGKDAGKGWGGKDAGKGWGGKGGSRPNKESKVWIGGLPDTITEEEIKQNFAQAGTIVFAKTLKGGTAKIEFSSPDEAKKAISLFNGAQVGAGTLEVDAWTGKDPSASGDGGSKGWTPVQPAGKGWR